MSTVLRLTKQRRAVLDIVVSASDHPTAAEIMERLQDRGQRFAYGTVYNSLKFLTSAGLVREVQVGDGGAAHYDGRTDEHSHIICSSCQAIDEFDWPQRDGMIAYARAQTRFEVRNASLVFEGLCPACQAMDSQKEEGLTSPLLR